MNPEITFHRGIQRIRRKYVGKQDFERLPDKLRTTISGIRKEINENLEVDRLKMLTDNGRPNLYFDFAESSEANAVAFASEGWATIGISTALMTAADQIAASVSQDALALNRLGLGPVYKDPELSRSHLESLLCRFVAAHEMGHHVGGHLGDTYACAFHSRFFELDCYSCAKPAPANNSIPEMRRLSSDARNATGFAISSGVPSLPDSFRYLVIRPERHCLSAPHP
jgi:hypothetical protein